MIRSKKKGKYMKDVFTGFRLAIGFALFEALIKALMLTGFVVLGYWR